jgi:hypothetical protein
MRVQRAALLGAWALASGAAQAVTLFSDGFEADTAALNQFTFVNGWVVTDGSVDVVDNFGGLPGNTVDLDGSTGNAGVFTKSLSLTAGVEYVAAFDIYGSRRGDTNQVTISFGASTLVLSLGSSDSNAGVSLAFTPAASQSYDLSFSNAGGDNLGALLDNVRVTFDEVVPPPIPEPQTYALMLLGVAAVGAAARRRRG